MDTLEWADVGDVEEDEGEEKVTAASVRELPSAELDGLWDKSVVSTHDGDPADRSTFSLIYTDDLKSRLLNYIHSTVAFSEAEVDFNVVSWNRYVLSPTGSVVKLTTIQQGGIAARSTWNRQDEFMSSISAEACYTAIASVSRSRFIGLLRAMRGLKPRIRYTYGKIVEINSHSLFSKWFSESGKLVQRLFSTVNEMVDDENGFVVVMIGKTPADPIISVMMELQTRWRV